VYHEVVARQAKAGRSGRAVAGERSMFDERSMIDFLTGSLTR